MVGGCVWYSVLGPGCMFGCCISSPWLNLGWTVTRDCLAVGVGRADG